MISTFRGCQNAGVVSEHGRNVRAGERKCLQLWNGLSLRWRLDPKGFFQEGAGRELVAWRRRVETQSTQKAEQDTKLRLGMCCWLQGSSPVVPCSTLLFQTSGLLSHCSGPKVVHVGTNP